MFTCISLEDNNYATFCFVKHRKTRQNIQQAYQKANCKFATKNQKLRLFWPNRSKKYLQKFATIVWVFKTHLADLSMDSE